MRTSSEERFKTNIGFSLPPDKKVLRDEYQDMLQDYTVIYEVELSVAANQQMVEKLKALTSPANADKDCKWSFVANGFSYNCANARTTFIVNYDTLKRIIAYEEAAD
jgi:hypothetical protein